MERKEKAEMGLGYGSEFQLLRFLGHHRQELDENIIKNTNINESLLYHMEWLDYPKNEKRKSLDATRKQFNIKTENNWMKKYYQLANRLAFINFMLDNGIQCSLLNIYFINGWNKDHKKNVLKIEYWKKAIQAEYLYLGINNEAKNFIKEIFIKC